MKKLLILVAVLLVAFGSTWDNAFKAFDKTIAAYEAAFPQADVYMSFSSDICINRASAGENVDDNGNIEAIKDETTATTFYPIPIRSLFIGDKNHGGLEEPDSNAISWTFLPNYSDNLAIVAPTDFNPLTDL